MKYIKEYNEFGYERNCDLFDDLFLSVADDLNLYEMIRNGKGGWNNYDFNSDLYVGRYFTSPIGNNGVELRLTIIKDAVSDEFQQVLYTFFNKFEKISGLKILTYGPAFKKSIEGGLRKSFYFVNKSDINDPVFTGSNELPKLNESKENLFQKVELNNNYLSQGNIVPLEERYINIIKRLYDKYEVGVYGDIMQIQLVEFTEEFPLEVFIGIRQFKDDYFAVYYTSTKRNTYICDQFDGLLECLEYCVNLSKEEYITESKEEVDDMIKKMFDPDKKSYVDKVSSILYNTKRDKNEYWKYLGERNGAEWSKNISDLLNNQTYRVMEDSELLKISEWLKPLLSNEPSAKGWNPTTESYQDWVQYPTLKSVQNSRFENCWFMKKDKDWSDMEYGWDMCVQAFSDEWYLVNVSDGRGYNDHWYRVDTLEGLHKFIIKNFIEPNETH